MAVRSLTLTTPAKINLYLKIIGRRPDGYHELLTLMQKLALFDQLDISQKSSPGIRLSCPDSDLPEDEGNIVYRAVLLFCKQMGISNPGIRIELRKNIPLAAGLGGGSSDAAAVLLGLNRLFETELSSKELSCLAVVLGADVPLFVHDSMAAAWATGIGEHLEEIPSLTEYTILLVNPGIEVSTKWAFETFALTAEEKKINLSYSQNEHVVNDVFSALKKRPFQPDQLYNDLESVTGETFGEILNIKSQLLACGASGALMSGSGSTVFGLFEAQNIDKARQCYHDFEKVYDQVFLVEALA